MRAANEEREAAREVERLGYWALWIGEGVGTRESVTQAATLLAWTSRIVVATGISNIDARDPVAMANGARALTDAYPDRFLLGVGVSHALSVAERGHSYALPIETMRTCLDAMDAALHRAVAPARHALRAAPRTGTGFPAQLRPGRGARRAKGRH